MGLFEKFRKKNEADAASAVWAQAYTAVPKFYVDPQGEPFGAVALTEGTDTVLFKAPQNQYQVDGRPVRQWKIVFFSTTKGEVLFEQEYFAALARLQEQKIDERDDAILIKGLSLAEMLQLQQEPPEDDAPGWDAITEECDRVYPHQEDPKHYGTLINWRFGGDQPLDGISVYDGGSYWHFVTYGLSELYDKESDIPEISGYGMEFTFKLKKDAYENEEDEIRCVCGILQSIARITFTNGELFHVYESLYTGQSEGIDCNRRSNITGFITVPDDKFHEIDTPNGKVCFVEFIGVTDRELKAVRNQEIRVKELYEKLGSDVTDYHRESVL